MTAFSTEPAARTTRTAWWDVHSRAWVAVIFVLTLLAYLPALGAGYIWDDAGHVTRPELRTVEGLFRIWFDVGATQQYYPVLHSAFWVEAHLWGDAPLGYHVLNVLLHATSACLFAAVMRRLDLRGGWIAALLFAVHPVAVESVAWISEQKNTLSTVLYLCATLAYLRYDRERQPARYATATVLFALALGTKTVTATLPAALLVVFWWRRGRLDGRRDVVPLLPWFALSVIAAFVTSWVERSLIGAHGGAFELSVLQRVLLAGRVFWFYVGKLLWPTDLSFVYPRWTIDAANPWLWLSVLLAVGLVIGCWAARRRALLAAVLVFGGSLFPALGFVNVYPFVYSYVADHFQYLADLAFWAAVGAGLAAMTARGHRWVPGLVAGIALALGMLTWREAQEYRDEITLYQTTLARNSTAWMAHTNLGIALVNAGRAGDAIPHYEAAVKLRPNYPEGENNLGAALNAVGRFAEAMPHLERALQLQPRYPEAHTNLAIALMNTGRSAEGLGHFETALRQKPDYPEAHFNLGLALAQSGRTAEAITHFQAALRLRPEYAEAELNLAVGLTLTDRFNEAEPHFRRALELNPNSASAHLLHGRALARAGRYTDALAAFTQATELNPNAGDAHLARGMLLRQLGRTAEAGREFEEAARLGAVR